MGTSRPSLQQTASSPYDIIIIGGGINGAGIARDAALRGLRTALFERFDFAFGTSSRSSKLIHGGIRYLEQGRLPLVFESSRERRILLGIAPHLVRPLPFIFPVYRGARWGPAFLGIGMWLYDFLAMFRNIRRHRMLTPDETLRLEPDLKSDGLAGAALYYDAQMDDARLCLANLMEARALGAEVRNYAAVTALIKSADGRIAGVRVRDRLDGSEAEISGRVVINAAGVWVGDIGAMDGPGSVPHLRRTRGSHIVLPALTRGHALVIRNPKDGRVLFIIPWNGLSLVGTTDLDFTGDANDVHCPPEDVDYLLAEVHRQMPGRKPGRADVIATFAGIRPLIDSGEDKPSDVSREERITESASGLISITGGKFTTYRRIAEKAVDRAARRLGGAPVRPCLTHSRPLWGGDMKNIEAYTHAQKENLARRHSIPADQAEHLIGAYGTRHTQILDLVREDGTLGERLHPSLPYLKAEVIHAVREEWAVTLADLLRRRTAVALGPERADPKLLDGALSLMASELNWSQDEREMQKRAYLDEIA